MNGQMIKTAVERIHMSAEMKRRIIRNCNIELSKQMEENTMKQRKNLRKPVAVLVALAICLTLSVTALAAPSVLQGFFRDIVVASGAITGTSYEQATDEIGMSVTVSGNELTALATITNPQMMPYVYAEKLGIAAYQIVDENGKLVKEGATESAEIVNGQAAVIIHLDDIGSGSYKLFVTAFVSEKKADQPLNINGHWECGFTK